MRILRRALYGLLIAAAILECAVLADAAVYRMERAPHMLAVGEPLPALEGYGRNLSFGLHQASTGCVIYRFVSLHCPACGQEEPSWKRPEIEAATHACETFILQVDLQNPSYYLGYTATTQILWVPLDWARSVNLTVTPTTILANAGRIAWVHEGELDQDQFAGLAVRIRRLHGG